MAYDYDPEDKFGYKDTLPENHPEKVITGVEFDEEFKKIEMAVQGIQDTLDGKLDVFTASLVMGGTYSLVSGLVVRSLKDELTAGQPLPAAIDCPDTFLICLDDGPFEGEDLVRSDWIVSSAAANVWIPLPYSRQDAVTGDPGEDGEDGKGWTSGNYNPSNGVVTFLSDDGLGFTTDDLRGDDGDDGDNGLNGPGWTGGSYSDITGVITFTSDDGLGFATDDVRGTNGTNGTHGINGKGWTSGAYDDTTGIATFTSDDGLEFATTDLRGTNGTNGTGTGTVKSVNSISPDGDGDVLLTATDVGAITREVDPVFSASPAAGISATDITNWNNAGGSDFSGNYNDLTNKPTIPTNNNQLTNGMGYITSANLSGYSTTSHNHNGVYAPNSHSHSNYAASNHNHSGVYAPANHTHSGSGFSGTYTAASSAIFTMTGSDKSAFTVVSATSARGSELKLQGKDVTGTQHIRATPEGLQVVNGSYAAMTLQLNNDGHLWCKGDVVAYSDERLKENIEVVGTGLLDQVRGVEFTWKEDGRLSSGVIAQDIQKVFPHLVLEVASSNTDDEETSLSVNYAGLTAYLIEEIKECRKRISQLEEANK
mgnify:CR=1 FL=1